MVGSKVLFTSAIFSGSISNKHNSLKPYILTSQDFDEIGRLTCNDSGGTPFTSNKVHIKILDRRMKRINNRSATAVIKMRYKECVELMNRLIDGEIAIELEYGPNSKYSFNSMTTYIKDSILKEVSN